MTRLTRWLIGLVIINAVLAIVLALWADQVQRTAAAVPAWMVFLQDISRITHFAEQSGLGLAAEVYYAVALPVLPMVTVVAYRLIVHADDGGYSTWVQRDLTRKQWWASVAAFPLFLLLGVGGVVAFRGADQRRVHIAGDLLSMTMNGWLVMASGGIFVAGALAVLKSLLLSRRR